MGDGLSTRTLKPGDTITVNYGYGAIIVIIVQSGLYFTEGEIVYSEDSLFLPHLWTLPLNAPWEYYSELK